MLTDFAQGLNISAFFLCVFPSSVTLLDCGQILSCGSNVFGQLGIGTTVTQSTDLLLVEVRLFPSSHVAFEVLLSQMPQSSLRWTLMNFRLVIVRA